MCCAQAVSEQIAVERDGAEREAREKETRVLSLTRELDEMMDKLEELERGKRQLQAELDELANNQGTADKNVSMSPSWTNAQKHRGTSSLMTTNDVGVIS